MDAALDRLDGYEAAHCLRRLPDPERVVLAAVTGYPDNEHRLRAYHAGFDSYLVKPVDPEHLRLLLLSAAGLHPILYPDTRRVPRAIRNRPPEEHSHLVDCLCA